MFTVAFSEEAVEDLDIALEYYRNISLALCENSLRILMKRLYNWKTFPISKFDMTKCVCEK